MVKLDAAGTIQWQKTYGGSDAEKINSISQTHDGGYVFVGTTSSPDGDVSGLHANEHWGDAWVVKLDNTGNITWQKTIGGTEQEFGEVLLQTSDGNYLVAGSTRSGDGDIVGHHSPDGVLYDIFLAKVSATNGDIIWTKCIGGTGSEHLGSIIANPDGTFMLGVTNGSLDGDFLGFPRSHDFCLLKLDNYGGSRPDVLNFIVKSAEGGYLLAGSS